MSKQEIFNSLKSEITIEEFKKREKTHKKVKNIIQNTLMVTFCSLSITGIVFARDISKRIYDNFYQTGNGIATAMNEGYIENIDMEYENANATLQNDETGQVIDDIDTKIKVNDLVMDNFNLSLTFSAELSEQAKKFINVEKVWNFNFPDLLITDEENKVLYCMDKTTFENYCNENNLDYKYDEFDENHCNCGVNNFVNKKEGNQVNVIYNIYTDSSTTFPKSKKLKIHLSQIKISEKVEAMQGDEEITLKGNWDFEIDVPEKMYNRQDTIYVQKSTTNEDYKVIAATLYNTGLELKANVKSEKQPQVPTSDELEFYKTIADEFKGSNEILRYISWKERQTEEMKEYNEKISYLFNIKIYLTNENGERFDLTMGPRENGSTGINDEGILEHEGVYDLTQYNATDKITVHFEYNGQNEEVVLEREEN